MKKAVLRTFFTFACVLFSIQCVVSQRTKEFRPQYDVARSIGEAFDGVRTALYLEDLKNQFNNTINITEIGLELLDQFKNAFESAGNSSCVSDLIYVLENIRLNDTSKRWALQMLDAFGKPASGILNGNLKWVGDYDECLNFRAPKQAGTNDGGFGGQYCDFQLTVTQISPETMGICLPDTCGTSEQEVIVKYLKYIGGTKLSSLTLTCKAKTIPLSNGAIATICVMSIFLLLTLLGSSVTAAKYVSTILKSGQRPASEHIINKGSTENGFVEKHDDSTIDDVLILTEGSRSKFSVFVEEFRNFLNCFCLFTNGAKLLNTDATEGQLLCLHGIRFLSMSWVIVCHMYMFPLKVVGSMKDILDKVDNWPFQAILNGWYSVDSFFLLSGFLMAYLYFQEASKKNGKIPWLYFYVHRYIRLTPVYMIVLAFYTTITPYLGSGPFWPDYQVEPICHKYWWWNILYINNFKDAAESCMGWSWYLANDMQFFVVSPLFLITLWRWPKIGYSILGLFLVGTWTAGFVITYHYDLIAGSLGNTKAIASNPAFLLRWGDYFDKIYTKPYTRCGPYIVGIALGYILFKKKKVHFKANNMTLWIGWLLAIPVGLTCVYGFQHASPDLVGASFFNSLLRTAYGLALGWVIFVCLLGQGGVVDKILSWKFFIPLSRLTYCAYLIHLVVIQTYTSSLRTTLAFSHPTIVMIFLGVMCVTYAMAMLVSLIFESPIIRLEKFVREKFKS